jgi:hypothetical protein
MPKRTVLWTPEAKTDLQRIFERNPRYREELPAIRPRVDERLENDAEGFIIDEDVEADSERRRAGLEPRTPLNDEQSVAIGVRFIQSERSVKIYAAWMYVKPSLRRTMN